MPKLGELLVASELVTEAKLAEALHTQVMWGGRLGTNLVELGHVEMDALSRALGRQHHLPAALGKHFEVAEPALQSMLNPNLAEQYACVPLVRAGKRIVVASISPLPPRARAIIADELAIDPERLVPSIAPELRIRYFLERIYQIPRSQRFLRVRGGSRSGAPMFAPVVGAGDPELTPEPVPSIEPVVLEPVLELPPVSDPPPDPTPPGERRHYVQTLADVLETHPDKDAILAAVDRLGMFAETPEPMLTPPPAMAATTPTETAAPTPTRMAAPTPAPKPIVAPRPIAAPAPIAAPKPIATRAPIAAQKPIATPAPIAALKPLAMPAPTLPRSLPSISSLPPVPASSPPSAAAGSALADLDGVMRAIRQGADRDIVAQLAIDAVVRFEPAIPAAMLLVVRGTSAQSWTSFSRDGAPIAPLAVPLDTAGLAATVNKSKTLGRGASSTLTAVDYMLLSALGAQHDDLVVAPITVMGQVAAMIALAVPTKVPVTRVDSIAMAAGSAFGRLMREATRRKT